MTDIVAGDPVSCSRLGGGLRSQAVQLLAVRAELEEAIGSCGRSDPGLVDATRPGVRLLDAVIEQLDRTGAVLQQYAQELAQVIEGARQLEARAHDAGLELQGLRVVEPWGVSPADSAARRQAAQPQLQQQADRLASGLGRSRGAVRRVMAQGTELLELASSSVRGSLGG